MAIQVHQIIEVECSCTDISTDMVINHLSPSEVCGEDDETLRIHAGYLLDECLATFRPRGLYKLHNPAICTLPPSYTIPGIKLVGTMAVLHGKSAYDRMSKATHCVMMAASLGSAAEIQNAQERLCRNEQDELVFDACLKAITERAADITNARIIKDALERDLYTDDRLTPGDGDFPNSDASQLLFYLQAEKRLGLTHDCTKSPLPSWCALGIIGMYDKTQKNRRRACGRCKFREFCSIRAIGMNCHGRKGSFS